MAQFWVIDQFKKRI